ncbi:MAG: FAD:protein FMN transferase, partial [Dermatophilaceae bacterium]
SPQAPSPQAPPSRPAAREAVAAPSPYVLSRVRHLMGTSVSLTVRGPQARSSTTERVMQEAFADLAWVDATFSRWRGDSELSRLRRGEVSVEQCCPQMGEVLRRCADAAEETDGAFAWVLPEEDGDQWLIEPTGLVKGWAIARAAKILGEGLVPAGHAYCVNAGGDIAVGGADTSPGGERPWRLGIEDPARRDRVARVVERHEGALATSGCAARGAHLVDPATGRRILRPGSVSVIAPDIVSADVWATALFVAPPELADRIAGRPGWQVVRLHGDETAQR